MSSEDSRSGGSSAGIPAAGAGASGSMPGASQSIEQPDPMIGQVLDGRYQIVSKLGEGGMGEVYAAEHTKIHKRVAVKLLRPEIVSNEEAVQRFKKEAFSASSIKHENIISIEDSGDLPDGRIYLCMELLEGQPLNDMLEQPMESARLLQIVIQTCHGLWAAHKAKIIHRDMKPENIFVTTGDVPKLLDFGIAKVSQGEGENHLTRTGTIFGTPFYMAPEQALGQAVDHRADIYAMGVIMYECFCGSVPFQGESFMGILTQHITAEPKSPIVMAQEHGRMLPPGMFEIITRCMAKDPNQRFQDMGELIESLVQVNRAVAGAGMSAYLEAQVPHAPMHSGGMRAPTPMPAPSSSHVAATMAASGPYAAPSGGYGTAGASQSLEMPASKSRTGLFVALIAIFLVVGGGGGYLYYASTQGGDKTGGGEPKDNPLAGNDTEPAAKPDAAAAVAQVTIDAGAVVAEADAAAEVAKESVYVILASIPSKAEVYRDGKKLKERTPTNIKVTKGEPVELVLKRRRYKDEVVTLDGTKTKFEVRLDRIRTSRPDPKNGKDGKTGKNGKNGDTDGKNGNGGGKVGPKKCTPKWCKIPANSSQTCCLLE